MPLRFSIHYNVDRSGRSISLDQAISVVNNPVRVQVQDNGRTRYWAYLAEHRHFVRVVVDVDGETIITAFIDSNFRPRR